jgi:hypothetical protein
VVRAEAFVSELDASPTLRGARKADVHLSPEEVDEWLELFDEDGS